MIRALRALVGAVSVAALVVVLGLGTWALLPAALGWRPTVVMTGSMAPRIVPGDIVVAAPFQPADLVPGRVVMFADAAEPDRLVVHRVTELTDDGALVTKGDANPTADLRPVLLDEVAGLPRLLVPGIGLPAVWLAAGQWAPLAGVAAVLALMTHGALSTIMAARDAPQGRRHAAGEART
ncbi:signal peptidase I [Cellulomonas sp. S1-8]|uniref:signal peptidase I n=1 Tax=Cellulomonas sp. S1-8 TaxID=2904790 RepID=UPI0022435023|nr:signal peptidase I [Cellulomonas sp. S1-8]UZN02929.1 signal peptidase I [Cellulomonas sp. S1-8]